MAAHPRTTAPEAAQHRRLTPSRASRPRPSAPLSRRHAAATSPRTGSSSSSRAAAARSRARYRMHGPAVALSPRLDLVVRPDPTHAQMRDRRREVLSRHQLRHSALGHIQHLPNLLVGHDRRLLIHTRSVPRRGATPFAYYSNRVVPYKGIYREEAPNPPPNSPSPAAPSRTRQRRPGLRRTRSTTASTSTAAAPATPGRSARSTGTRTASSTSSAWTRPTAVSGPS